MFYQFIRWYFGVMVKMYFRKVYITGTENVPEGKPVIYASNHPAGFIEAIILTTNVKQPIHFLVLGSFLTSKLLQWFFKGVKMVPIFRRDIAGSRSIEKNKSTFEYVYNELKENAHILIYPEAKTKFLYKVRPLKKGIARMARGFLKRGSHSELYIVPVGVNFNFPTRFRSDVFFQIGEPIKFDNIDGEEAPWLKNMIDRTAEGMKKLVFDVDSEARHSAVQELVEIFHYQEQNGLDLNKGPYIKDSGHVQVIRDFVSKLDNFDDDEFEVLRSKLTSYTTFRKQKKLTERSISNRSKISVLHYILLIVGFPLFLIGVLLHGLTFLGGYIVKQNIVKRVEYKAGVAGAVPTILILIFIILSIIFSFVFHWGFAILAFMLPFSLFFMVFYYDFAKLLFCKFKITLLSQKEKEILLSLRNEIFKYLKP